MSFLKPETILPYIGLSAGMSVADIGTGTGHYAILMSSLVGAEGAVYAIDLQKGLLDRLASEIHEKEITNIHIIWGDAETVGGTKIRSSIVDRVLVANVLFQTESKSGLVHEIKRILKQNGKVVVVDWSESFAGLGPHPQQVVDENTTLSLFENNGFVLEKRFEAGAHHYGLVFKHVI